ncbi:MAG TPA: anthranilate synthase component I family protein [Saprospiraceae bacterium]|nr:anthranilate synthase component I family protein [Saprospiraceae bacterium]HPG06275.1 anthranilate synthase component I family protein [Saprospiraceae bacterium]HPR00054.1 anthranilate synthase component I family protein [Saprospiraceae bacterium]HQU54305.1 anthranilate synthase component I family protein [Saprospiraceae bacterium]HRV85255.1 anthranilate synthase component I family protein [Saprospiraceae bacterium]
MKKIQINARVTKGLADFITPVTSYLKLRDHYTHPVLLESNDFSNKEESFSFIGLETIASFQVKNNQIRMTWPDKSVERLAVNGIADVPAALNAFIHSFDIGYDAPYPLVNGFFGHTNFEGVRYFDTLEFDDEKRIQDIPEMHYELHRFILAFNHYKDEYYLIENLVEGWSSQLEDLRRILFSRNFTTYPFHLSGSETSNLTDQEFMDLVTKGKHHCQIGDVFQIVLSRQFQQGFTGDEFNVYRILRSINPSPYLFYFDLGSYKIFGSSPEAQMVIKNGVARVNPIAGTYRRTGDAEEDLLKAEALTKDPKENAEHIMLVDLARNDLGKHTQNVQVKDLKSIHFYSHVMHLVSTVEGELYPESNPVQIFADTFPAGTLSGAPKYKAIELIHAYENVQRSYYGGAIGYIQLNGDMNQAILIRSFLSKDHKLTYQAGAGVVVSSVEASELQEVNNKLGALKRALEIAEKIES